MRRALAAVATAAALAVTGAPAHAKPHRPAVKKQAMAKKPRVLSPRRRGVVGGAAWPAPWASRRPVAPWWPLAAPAAATLPVAPAAAVDAPAPAVPAPTTTTTTTAATPTTPAPAPPALPRRTGVDEGEYYVRPARTLLGAGTEELNVSNFGMDDHDLTIDDAAGHRIAQAALAAGATAKILVDLPAGTYRLYCSLLDHDAAGMHAALTVQ